MKRIYFKAIGLHVKLQPSVVSRGLWACWGYVPRLLMFDPRCKFKNALMLSLSTRPSCDGKQPLESKFCTTVNLVKALPSISALWLVLFIKKDPNAHDQTLQSKLRCFDDLILLITQTWTFHPTVSHIIWSSNFVLQLFGEIGLLGKVAPQHVVLEPRSEFKNVWMMISQMFHVTDYSQRKRKAVVTASAVSFIINSFSLVNNSLNILTVNHIN